MAALLATSDRFSGMSLAARAFPHFAPPRRPSATAAGFFPLVASGGASPVASFPTRKAISFTPSGPCLPLLERLGIWRPYHMQGDLFSCFAQKATISMVASC